MPHPHVSTSERDRIGLCCPVRSCRQDMTGSGINSTDDLIRNGNTIFKCAKLNCCETSTWRIAYYILIRIDIVMLHSWIHMVMWWLCRHANAYLSNTFDVSARCQQNPEHTSRPTRDERESSRYIVCVCLFCACMPLHFWTIFSSSVSIHRMYWCI